MRRNRPGTGQLLPCVAEFVSRAPNIYTSGCHRVSACRPFYKRSIDWLKIRVAHTADFEVIGCVPTRSEKAIRVLLLGEKHQGRLVYKGEVGSGLTRRQRQDFLAELAKAPKLQEPVNCPSGSICRLPGWRCRVRYFGLTEMGHLRSPTFEGLI